MVGPPPITESLEAALKAASLRQSVIANNIANLNTPGYRRRAVVFEKHLVAALEAGKEKLGDVPMEIFQPQTTSVNALGNDVSLEKEIGDMIQNQAMYKTYLRVLNRLYRRMELAMQGSR